MADYAVVSRQLTTLMYQQMSARVIEAPTVLYLMRTSFFHYYLECRANNVILCLLTRYWLKSLTTASMDGIRVSCAMMCSRGWTRWSAIAERFGTFSVWRMRTQWSRRLCRSRYFCCVARLMSCSDFLVLFLVRFGWKYVRQRLIR